MNNSRCDRYLESIAAMAGGDTEVSGSEHVLNCPECSTKLAQMRKILERGRVQTFEAPHDVLLRAKNIMPAAEKRSILARLVGNSLQFAGVRSTTAETFQLAFEADDTQVRLMYSETSKGWDVIGQVQPIVDLITAGDKQVKVDPQGRFEFSAKSLADTQIRIARAAGEIVIPSAQESLDGGS